VIAKGTRKGDNVVLWSPLGGVVTGEVNSIEELRARVTAARATFDSYLRGDVIVTDTGSGPLRDYYELLQAMLRHVDIRETERSTLAKRRDVTIRLIFYDKSVRAIFAREYRSLIVAGYDAVGMPVPDFSRLSRKQALAAITGFEEKADAKPSEAAERLRPYLVDGLVQLSDRYIPITWI